MASSPNQFSLFATQVASAVILLGIATFSVLAFSSFNSIIGVTFRSSLGFAHSVGAQLKPQSDYDTTKQLLHHSFHPCFEGR
ncbi:hypothetical protein N7465_004263 [Penicillium sp. CMV-2018d]|nr:hypothetical protein N7465_004263 [Penicillium sp. CMV-2018d]